jgi:hypothetical protein
MTDVELRHFQRAAADIGAHGDNDTLPFDVDTRFVKYSREELSRLAFSYYQDLASTNKKAVRKIVDALQVFSERLLVPSGSTGFRVSTKIHPFWNLYFNGLGIAIAEAGEPRRSDRAHAYRFSAAADHEIFDRNWSWRKFREATLADCEGQPDSAVVVQTDIASFYEHVYHHRLENCIDDLYPSNSTVATQIDRLLNKFSSGRSFGLPIGGQCSRILAEVLLASIDRRLSDEDISWRRYVDDFVLVTASQEDAYRALSVVSNALADYGLSLNKTKTTMLSKKHYMDYVRSQLTPASNDAGKLREIDLHFDPYTDNPHDDFEELKKTVKNIQVGSLLSLELEKGQPDFVLVSRIGRTLKLHTPEVALHLCETLISEKNLHAFRGSWATIMRGIGALRADANFSAIFGKLDEALDRIPEHSSHLLRAEASCLHYLRPIRFVRTDKRAKYVRSLYSSSPSETIRRACIDCWRLWKDRHNFVGLRNRWNSMGAEEQRMLWLAASEFSDDGDKFRKQVSASLERSWQLGIERGTGGPSFRDAYQKWCDNDALSKPAE